MGRLGASFPIMTLRSSKRCPRQRRCRALNTLQGLEMNDSTWNTAPLFVPAFRLTTPSGGSVPDFGNTFVLMLGSLTALFSLHRDVFHCQDLGSGMKVLGGDFAVFHWRHGAREHYFSATRCERFRYVHHEIPVGKNKAAGKFMRVTAFRPRSADRTPAKDVLSYARNNALVMRLERK